MAYDFIDSVLAKMVAGESASPVSSYLGMRMTAFGRGTATYELTVEKELTNAMGVLQGGVVTVLADAAMAAASMTVLTDEIREVLRQVAVYAGFPAAWDALATANTVFARAAAATG